MKLVKRVKVVTLSFMVEDSAEYREAIEAINIEVRNWLRRRLGCLVSLEVRSHV